MLLTSRSPLTRWVSALAGASVVAVSALASMPSASAAVPRFTNTVVWTAPSVTTPYGTSVSSPAGGGKFTLTPTTYSAGTFTPNPALATPSASVSVQAYDAAGNAVVLTGSTPTATCSLYAATDTLYKTPLSGVVAGATRYVTRCTPSATVAGYTNTLINGTGVVQGEVTLTPTYSQPTSVNALTALGSYPTSLGYQSVKKNGIATAAPTATCGIYAAADTTYAGTNFMGKVSAIGSYNAHCTFAAQAAPALWATYYNADVAITVTGVPTVGGITCSPSSVTYDGLAKTPCTATVTGTGLSTSVPVTYANNIHAGTATASFNYAGSGTYAPASGSTTFTITPNSTTTTVTCSPVSMVATGQPLTPCTAAVTSTDGLNLTATPTYVNNVAAGTATASYTYPGDADHTSSTGSANFSIVAHYALTASSANITYGDATPNITYGSSPTINAGDWLTLPTCGVYTDGTYTTAVTGTAAAGTYVTHCSGGSISTGVLDLVDGSLVVAKAASSTVITCPTSATYTGSALTPCTAAVTGAGGLNLTATPTYVNNVAVGTATASYTYPGDADHTSSTGSANFSIVAHYALTASSANITYGDATPNITYGSSPTINAGDWLTLPTCGVYTDGTYTTAVTGTAAAGTYVTHCSGGSISTGVLDLVDGSLVVAKAASSTVITCPTSATYTGSALTPCTAAVTGAGGLNTAATTTYANNTDAGTATADATYAGDANHNGSTATQVSFTVAKASQTLTYSGDYTRAPAQAVRMTGQQLNVVARTPAACTGAITYSLDRNPLTGAVGAYSINATTTAANTTNWLAGVYIVTTSAAADANCNAATLNSVLTIAPNTSRARGGGFYTDGTSLVNVGFQVAASPSQAGSFVLNQTNGWRLIGTTSTYTSLTNPTRRQISGTGNLSYWNGTGWTSVGSAIAFTAVLTQSTSSVATTITYTPTGSQPALPSSATFVVNSAPATAATTFSAGA